MLVGFEFIWDEAPLLIEVAKRLNEKGAKIIGVTLGNRWCSLLRDCKFTLVSLSDYLKANWDKTRITDELLEEYENRYGDEHQLSYFINVDRLINDVNKRKFKTREDKLKFLIIHFRFWEEFFEKYDVDSFYSTGTAFLGLLTGMAVAQKRSKRFKSIYTTREGNPRIVFVENYDDHWTSVNVVYKELLERQLTSEEGEFAKNYLKQFRQKATKPSYTRHSWHISSFSAPFIGEFLRRAKRRIIYKWGKGRFDYVTPPLLGRVLKETKVIMKRKILNSFYFPQNISLNGHYVFSPLQLQPEIAIDVCGKWYSNQIAVIENISKSLPLNYKLYVKEHKVAVGRREGLFSYYDKLRRLPNVVLINPSEDSHKLIRNADLVIVVVGTVGWEALLYGKPVITLGNVFYNDSGLVCKLNDYRDLKKTILHLLNNYQLKEDELLKYIVALNRGTSKGYFNVPHSDRAALYPDNIIDISNAILQDIENK